MLRSTTSRTTTSRASLRTIVVPLPTPSIFTTTPTPIRFQSRYISDLQTFRTRHGNVKLNLKSKGAVGIAQSRGERPYQEDAYSVHSLAIPKSALKWNVLDDRLGVGWNPVELEGFEGEVVVDESSQGESSEGGGEETVASLTASRGRGRASDEEVKRQVAFFGVFDGHGGSQVSTYLRSQLHHLIEQSSPSSIPSTIDSYRKLGGYLKRYQGGPLERFRKGSELYQERRGMSLDEMGVLAYLQADNAVLEDESTKEAGSTATIAMLHSLDLPYSFPYYASSLLSLTIAHLGDTSALLCSSSQGRARRLTEPHHGDSRVEGERLRISGTGIITDSFGETRFGGTLANTRGIGDRHFKPLGVIGEPELVKRVLKGLEWSFLCLCSDGVTDVISDQEIVDLVRGERDPTRAAKKIVSFAEDVGGDDNMTCLIIPLPSWGKMGGIDSTADRREYRLRQVSGASRRQKRM